MAEMICSIISVYGFFKSTLPREVQFIPVVPAYYFILRSVQIQKIKYMQ